MEKIRFDNSTKELTRDLRLLREIEKNSENAYICLNFKNKSSNYTFYKNQIKIKTVEFPKGVNVVTTIGKDDVIKINEGRRSGVADKGFSMYLKYPYKGKIYKHKITIAVASGRVLLYEDKKGF